MSAHRNSGCRLRDFTWRGHRCIALENERLRVLVAASKGAGRFPVLGYWQLFGGGPNYPWHRSHFLAALEPACDLPSLSEAAARGTAIALDPGESVETIMEASVFSGLDQVHAVEPGGIIR